MQQTTTENVTQPGLFTGPWSRREMLQRLGALGAGAVFGRALVAQVEQGAEVTEQMVHNAAWIAGLELDDEKTGLMLRGVRELLGDFDKLRGVELDNSVPPALVLETLAADAPSSAVDRSAAAPVATDPGDVPGSEEDVAFAPIGKLAAWIHARRISSLELTQLYLSRLRRLDPTLECVITLTEELALAQARRADEDLASGTWHGPLHGIPWGAKDLLAVPGYPTTWGAMPYKTQRREETATVARRLEQAGAVLGAKLTLGALAWGDVWFGGKTRNPWNTEQGSSGSSAGPAAATAAGLVGFAIGSETWGSIISPCTRCGATGLRPTFGRVSRHGAMALSWSMDKLGPIARSVEDCALVLAAIHGADGQDPAAVSRPFAWPPRRDPRTLRIGFVKEEFERDRTEGIDDPAQRARAAEWSEHDRRTLRELTDLGMELRPLRLPASYPVEALSLILTAEAATAFDELTRSGRDALLVRQMDQAWPNVFRQGQMIPAVEYIRANRIRRLVMQEMQRAMADVDVYVCPSFGGDNLLLTNLTGHPAVVLPNGFRSDDGTPTSITFMGRLYGESDLLAVARAYQEATSYHVKRPPTG